MWLAVAGASLAALASAQDGSPPRELYISSFTAEQPTVTGNGGSSVPVMEATDSSEEISKKSTDIVRGVVEAFLHREHLEQGELDCLSKGSGHLAGDVTTVSANVASMFGQALGRGPRPEGMSAGTQATPNDGAGSIEARVAAISSGRSPELSPAPAPRSQQQDAHDVEREDDQKSAASQTLDFFYGDRRRLQIKLNAQMMQMAPALFMQLGMSMKEIVSLTHNIVQDCLHHDALEALDTAASHLQSVDYVSGHIMANGADIVTELADAEQAYQDDDYHGFGTGMGTAMRKTLLSNAEGTNLPEGLPGKYVMSNVTEGMLKGLFSDGSAVDVKVPGDLDRAPSVINVDLHECVSKNLKFFQNVWAEAMFIFAKRAANLAEKDEVQWGTATALTMMEVPEALKKCDLDSEKQEILEDALKGLASGGGGLGFDLHAPTGARVSSDSMKDHMAITVKDWAKMRWETFGQDLGHLLQEMAVTVYDKKYAIDKDGVLRKRVVELSAQERGAAAGRLRAGASTVSVPFVACCASALLFVAAARLVRRSAQASELWIDGAE